MEVHQSLFSGFVHDYANLFVVQRILHCVLSATIPSDNVMNSDGSGQSMTIGSLYII
jgi:hypothetical protein